MLGFAFRPPILVPNFSLIGAHIHKLERFLQSVQNDEKEDEKTKKFLLTPISGIA